MKIKLLAVAVAGILLSGCNDDNLDASSQSVQAYDPAVQNMTAVAVCADGTTETSKTDYYGNAKFFKLTPQFSPETCTFTFTGDATSVDTSNGKSMDGVVYTIPAGLAQAGKAITASPLTTLIAKELEATGAEYTPAAATTVLTSLGLGSVLNGGVDVAELLSNTEAVLEELASDPDPVVKANASLLAATTAVLSDVLAADQTATATELAKSTSALADAVIVSEPNYPKDSTGQVVTVTVTPADITTVVDAVKAAPEVVPTVPKQKPTEGKPVPQPKPPTGGGTGGTGGTGGAGGAGD